MPVDSAYLVIVIDQQTPAGDLIDACYRIPVNDVVQVEVAEGAWQHPVWQR